MEYAYQKQVTMPFADAVAAVRAALRAEGFGVVTEIDVQATFKEKLGAEVEQYVILGACNPTAARTVLDIDKLIGLLLPCNVVVFETAGQLTVAAIRPTVTMEVADAHHTLGPVAGAIEAKLVAAVDAVEE